MSAVTPCHLCSRTPFDPDDFNSNEAFHVAMDYSGHHTVADRQLAGLALLSWIDDGGLTAEGWSEERIEIQRGSVVRRLQKEGVL